MAWIPLLINRGNPSYLLISLSSLGTILSAPMLGDGGSRIFAASVAVDIMQIGIGFSWLCIALTQGVKQSLLPAPFSDPTGLSESLPKKISFDSVFSILLMALVIIPYTPLKQFASLKRMATSQCANDQYTVVTNIGTGGTLLLDIIPDDQKPNFLKGQIRHVDFMNGIPPDAWWRDGAVNFTGKSLLTAYQPSYSSRYMNSQYPVFSSQSLAEFYGHAVRLCIDKQEKKNMFGVSYLKLDSITMLE